MRAQFAVFMILSNEYARELNQQCFNDSLMVFYMFLGFYLLVENQSVLAALMMTVGLSIKVGPLLLLPALLGWIQYHNGTKKTLICLIIIVGFQLMIALPFTNDYVAREWFDF